MAYGLLYGLMLAQQPGVPAGSVATLSALAALSGAVWGWPLQRLARHLERARHPVPVIVMLGIIAASAFAVLDISPTLLFIALSAPPTVWHRYLAEAVYWDLLRGALVGATTFAVALAGATSDGLAIARRQAQEAIEARIHAELQALRSQLDPHFLFNTLNSITMLASDNPGRAVKALQHFAALMRYVLDTRRAEYDEVTVEHELAFVKDYLALESLRLGDRLRTQIVVEEDAMEYALPSLTIQPLVENAVRYGIAPRARGGTLSIAARLRHDRLMVEVWDDGGVSAVPPQAPGRGIGLSIVRRRLMARHGVAASVQCTTHAARGWTVVVELPAVPLTLPAVPVTLHARPSSGTGALAGAAVG